jgi:hypothetical protein
MTPFELESRDERSRGAYARHALAASLLAAVALVVACGGGGTDGTVVPTATPSAFTQGTITGFGSVVVNGVRFDDTSATVTDDSGTAKTASALKLGMRVEVDSGAVDAAAGTATAKAFRFGGQLLGPVAAVNTTANTLTVLGQSIDITSTTVFDSSLSGGIGAVAPGSVIEVHGLPDAATGHIVATRVEAETGVTAYKLVGTVANLDTTAKTFTIGGATVNYSSLAAASVPGTLANGVVLRVLLATTQANGQWVAQSLGGKASKPTEHSAAMVRGAITAFTSATAFTVDTLVVDATNATFPDGSSGLALGVQVEVQGTVTNGVLVATKVSVEAKHANDDSHRLQLHGQITALDTTAKTFVVRETTVTYTDATTYVNGTVASLAVGASVDVKGTVGSTRTQVQASEIRFK